MSTLKFFSYTKSGGIIISIQASIQVNSEVFFWDKCQATLHECKDWKQAKTIAQGIANVTGGVVRVTKVDNTHTTQAQVGRNNGTYIHPVQVDLPQTDLLQLLDCFSILDALGGDISGEYKEDLKRLHARGRTCSEALYHNAYQLHSQP